MGYLPEVVSSPRLLQPLRHGGAERRLAGLDPSLENAEYAALYDQKVHELRDVLYDSGAADDVLSSWAETLGRRT